MAKWPTVELDFYCPYCFALVKKSTHVSEEMGTHWTCWCDCYARAYDDPKRVAEVTLEVWNEYISMSDNYAFVQVLNRCGGAENLEIINGLSGNYDIWCPGCGRPRKLGGKGMWLSKPDRKYVCAYGVCSACMDKQNTLNEQEMTAFIDRAVERLIAHYPSLQLPP